MRKDKIKAISLSEEVTSSLTTLPQTNWTESKVERVIQEWYDSGRLVEREGIGKYTPA